MYLYTHLDLSPISDRYSQFDAQARTRKAQKIPQSITSICPSPVTYHLMQTLDARAWVVAIALICCPASFRKWREIPNLATLAGEHKVASHVSFALACQRNHSVCFPCWLSLRGRPPSLGTCLLFHSLLRLVAAGSTLSARWPDAVQTWVSTSLLAGPV